MRAITVAGIIVSVALAGCFGTSGTGAEDDETAMGQDVVREVIDLSYTGTTSTPSGEPIGFEDTQPVKVPGDALNLTFSITGDPLRDSGPWLSVQTAAGRHLGLVTPEDPPVVIPYSSLSGLLGQELTFRVFGATAPTEPYEVTVQVAVGSPAPITGLPMLPVEPPSAPAVVVAVIDSGLNLYHEAFRTDTALPGHAFDAVTGEAPREVTITLGGDRTFDKLRDEHVWRAMDAEVLYAFPQLNAYGISLFGDDDPSPVLDEGGHGTGTAARVRAMAPNATLLIIKTPATILHSAMAMEWVAVQPWIDVVSVSRGIQGNLPGYPVQDVNSPAAGVRMAAASRAAHDAGILLVNSAGNDPSFTVADPMDSPPWVISVTGAQPESRSRSVIASHGADFAATFVADVPSHSSADSWTWNAGTSFAAPMAAGAIAQALVEVREAAGYTAGRSAGLLVDAPDMALRHRDFRDAFNRTALYWSTTDYDPTQPPPGGVLGQALGASTPILPTPYVDLGWGYVDANVSRDAAAYLLGTYDPPPKSPDAVAYQDAVYAAREAYWT